MFTGVPGVRIVAQDDAPVQNDGDGQGLVERGSHGSIRIEGNGGDVAQGDTCGDPGSYSISGQDGDCCGDYACPIGDCYHD